MEQITQVQSITEVKELSHIVTLVGNDEQFTWSAERPETEYEYTKSYSLTFHNEQDPAQVELELKCEIRSNKNMEELAVTLLASDETKVNHYSIAKLQQSLLQNSAQEIYSTEHSKEEPEESMYPLALANHMIFSYAYVLPMEMEEPEEIEQAEIQE